MVVVGTGETTETPTAKKTKNTGLGVSSFLRRPDGTSSMSDDLKWQRSNGLKILEGSMVSLNKAGY